MRDSIAQLDEKIRIGKGAEVRESLIRLCAKPSNIATTDFAKVAQLCWRVGLPDLGLKLLQPILRPRARRPREADDFQIAEYAACLIRIGALEEASLLLAEISPKKTSQVWLYRAFTKIGMWEYAKAIPLLKAYLKSEVSSYQKLVAEVNLASALIYEGKHEEAKHLLRELTHETSLRRLNLLLANSLELSAANFVYEHQLRKAEPFLERGEKLLKSHGTIDAFFIAKWRGIISFQNEKDISIAIDHLDKVRGAARLAGHWETLRDCDRFEMLRTKSPDLLYKIYFGTPYLDYRERLLRDMNWKQDLPEAFLWNLSSVNGRSQPTDFLFGGGGLKAGQALFRLALGLASDFYRPHRVAPLFRQLFPDEFYNPDSSRHRVHELVRRLRQWFVAKKLPVRIEEREGNYTYTSSKPCSLLVPLRTEQVARWRLVVEELRQRFHGDEFGIQEASRHLETSSMSLLRLLKEALAENAVTREGKGKATRYRIATKI